MRLGGRGTIVLTLLFLCVVIDRMKPVSLESFRDHVMDKHNHRDKGFETEYQVSSAGVSMFVL